MWLYLVGRGVIRMFNGMGMFVLGAFFPYFGEFDIVMYGSGFNEYVSMCVLIVFFRTCQSLCWSCVMLCMLAS